MKIRRIKLMRSTETPSGFVCPAKPIANLPVEIYFIVKHKFFTLIELLVVIAIIAVLASLLLPSLNRAKEVAKRINCVNGIRSVGTLTLSYVNDYNGFLMAFWQSNTYKLPGLNNGSPYWPRYFYYLGYLPDYTILHCPSGPTYNNYNDGNGEQIDIKTNYTWTYGRPFGSATNYHGVNWASWICYVKIIQPSTAIAYADTSYKAAYGYVQNASIFMAYNADTSPYVHLRHCGRCNIWFADGHVDSVGSQNLTELGISVYRTSGYSLITF